MQVPAAPAGSAAQGSRSPSRSRCPRRRRPRTRRRGGSAAQRPATLPTAARHWRPTQGPTAESTYAIILDTGQGKCFNLAWSPTSTPDTRALIILGIPRAPSQHQNYSAWLKAKGEHNLCASLPWGAGAEGPGTTLLLTDCPSSRREPLEHNTAFTGAKEKGSRSHNAF